MANYVLAGDQARWAGVSDNLALAVGRERAGLILDISRDQMASDIGVSSSPRTMIIRRKLVGNEQRLEAKTSTPGMIHEGSLAEVAFPAAFRPVFPNGWADVAKREGFELPKESLEK